VVYDDNPIDAVDTDGKIMDMPQKGEGPHACNLWALSCSNSIPNQTYFSRTTVRHADHKGRIIAGSNKHGCTTEVFTTLGATKTEWAKMLFSW
jgi:hypothetical protein